MSTTWRLERASGVRDDAPGIFVPASELPGAVIGDEVLVASGRGRTGGRRASIAGVHERDEEQFFRLDFDSPG